VLDTTDTRALAKLSRRLLGFAYRPGERDCLVLNDPEGVPRPAFQQVETLPPPTWPTGPRPQMLHLDLTAETRAELDEQHSRAPALGARLPADRAETRRSHCGVHADPFCVFVA
jgi:hypothetical protein